MYTPSFAASITWFSCFLSGYLFVLITNWHQLVFSKYIVVVFTMVVLLGIHLIYSLVPFHFSSSHSNIIWIPLRSYYEQSTVNALKDVLLKGGAYISAGFIVAKYIKHKMCNIVVIVIGVAFFAGVIECLQLYLPGRVADITDIFMAPLLFIIGYGFYLRGLPYYTALIAEIAIVLKNIDAKSH